MTQTPHEARRERIARIIDPSSWQVLDSYLERVKRHHPHGGYDPDNFTDKASLAKADEILADDPALVLVEALRMIAGEIPCPDNLMGNADIARAALDAYQSTDKGDAE